VEPFQYPTQLTRNHGPSGYKHYSSFKDWVRDDFLFRCVYCLKRERWDIASNSFALDHFVPQKTSEEGKLDYDNLVYSCGACNAAKGSQSVPDPCSELSAATVVVHEDGTIEPTTADARRIILKLGLDSPEYTHFRQTFIDIVALAFANSESNPSYRRLMGYPDPLPNLQRKVPPGGNSRPEGIEQSCLSLQEKGLLEMTY